MKKPCNHKIRPISYNEYFNVGNRILIDIEHKHCDHVHHDPVQVIKPDYPVKPPHKPEECKPVPPVKPPHKPEECKPVPPHDCCCDDIWTDDCNHPNHECKPPHHHKPQKPTCNHESQLKDRDCDGFYEGTFIYKH